MNKPSLLAPVVLSAVAACSPYINGQKFFRVQGVPETIVVSRAPEVGPCVIDEVTTLRRGSKVAMQAVLPRGSSPECAKQAQQLLASEAQL